MSKELVMEVTQTLTPLNQSQHLPFTFTIDRRFEALACEFSYSPKEVALAEGRPFIEAALPQFFLPEQPLPNSEEFEPLQNLLTVSVTYENTYVGCRHYQNPQQAWEISGSASSKGYRKQRILPGTWVFKVNVHCICSAEVAMTLRVWGVSADEFL